MADNTDYNKLANKLIEIDDSFNEISTITKMLNIWVKDNYYELIPIMNILNEKITNATKILRK